MQQSKEEKKVVLQEACINTPSDNTCREKPEEEPEVALLALQNTMVSYVAQLKTQEKREFSA
jgi:hypothetical protein